MSEKVQFCYLGPPKTASTWFFRCLEDHPEICAPVQDELYYFDQYHAKGEDWYHGFFPDKPGIRIDCTPSTIAQRSALERMIEYNPDMKVAFTLRNPVDRAFSAYWHVRKRRQITWRMEDIFGSYPAYLMWLAPGLFAKDVEYLLKTLPRENILFYRFEDIKKDPDGSVKKLYEFIGVDAGVTPPSLQKRVNISGAQTNPFHLYSGKILRRILPQDVYDSNIVQKYFLGKSEYIKGVPKDLRAKLIELCEDDIKLYESLLDIDLSDWRKSI